MANNYGYQPHYPNGFQNYMPQTPSYLNGYNVPQYQQPTNTNKIFVNGIEDVKGRYLPPNSNVLFLDNEKPVIYEKIVDGTGRYDVKVYEFKEKQDENGQKVQDSTNLSNYVKTTDLDPIKSKIQDIETKLSKMTAQPKTIDVKKEA